MHSLLSFYSLRCSFFFASCFFLHSYYVGVSYVDSVFAHRSAVFSDAPENIFLAGCARRTRPDMRLELVLFLHIGGFGARVSRPVFFYLFPDPLAARCFARGKARRLLAGTVCLIGSTEIAAMLSFLHLCICAPNVILYLMSVFSLHVKFFYVFCSSKVSVVLMLPDAIWIALK